jgi:hypothetical protein
MSGAGDEDDDDDAVGELPDFNLAESDDDDDNLAAFGLQGDDDGDDSDDVDDPDLATGVTVARIWCSRVQLRALGERAQQSVAAGRPDPRQNGRLVYYWT